MPCETYSPSEMRAMEGKIYKTDIDAVTRAACDMRTILRRHGFENELTSETRSWIAKHDKRDAERIAEETRTGKRKSAREAALDKLNMDERRILGL